MIKFIDLPISIANEDPELTGNTTLNAVVGSESVIRLTATDGNGDLVTYDMLVPVPGSTFNNVTGVFRWTPADLTPVTLR